MTQDEHFDVASYALGVLDERDAARFEDHLIECQRCAYELESFVQVADLLADVDAPAVVAAEESRRDGVLLHKMIGEVRHERRRASSRRLYSLAAAVVVFAMLSIGALFAGARWFTPGNAGTPVANGSASPLPPLPNVDNGAGVGGPEIAGQRYGKTDPHTGVRLDAALDKKTWGTQIAFAVSGIQGAQTCRLVAVHTDGSSEPLVSWTVDEKGWGTAANPQPLNLVAITATPREQIAQVQVQKTTPDGGSEILVQAPN